MRILLENLGFLRLIRIQRTPRLSPWFIVPVVAIEHLERDAIFRPYDVCLG